AGLAPAAHRSDRADAAHPLGADLRAAAAHAGRPGADPCGRGARRPAGAGADQGRAPPRPAAAGAVPALGRPRGAGRFRLLLAHPRAGGGAHPREAAGDLPARGDGLRHRAADRHPGRYRLGRAAGPADGLAGQRRRALRHLDAEFLAWHHDDPALLGAARLAAALRLRAAQRGPGAEPGDDHHAGLRARLRHRRGADAAHAGGDAGGAGPGLCADGPRQGPRRAGGGGAACAAQRADPGGDARDDRVRAAAGGRGADGADLHHPRLRQADRRCGVQPGLPRGAGSRHGDRADLRRALARRRSPVHGGQPAAAGRM
ncbi:MAG: ABC transporter, permease protein 1 (cluster 5, nickel/peptides/opines), partial [uncultured Craurococcus sp.]